MEGGAQLPHDCLRRIHEAMVIMQEPDHQPNAMRCILCQGYFQNPDDFARHYRRLHKDCKVKCNRCHNRFHTEQILATHLLDGHHRGFAYECVRSQFGQSVWGSGLTSTEFHSLIGHNILPPDGVNHPPVPADGHFVRAHAQLVLSYGALRISQLQASSRAGPLGRMLKKFKRFT